MAKLAGGSSRAPELLLATLLNSASCSRADCAAAHARQADGLSSSEHRLVRFISTILEDSRLFVAGRPLFEGVLEGRWLHINRTCFEEMSGLEEQAKSLGLIDPSKPTDPGKLVQRVLSEVGIFYDISTTFISINPHLLVATLAAARNTRDGGLLDLLLADNMREAVQAAALRQQVCGFELDKDTVQGIKYMLSAVSLFFGTGIVLGHMVSA